MQQGRCIPYVSAQVLMSIYLLDGKSKMSA